MTATPFAHTMMQIDGGPLVSGAQLLVGNEVIQLQGESTVEWRNQLWQIYEYPEGYALPAGWTNNNGVYENSAVLPPTFTIPDPLVRWGKFLTRLVVNQGILAGVYTPGGLQPQVDTTAVLQTKSPFLGLTDVAFQETNQFDAVRQWIGELKRTLRQLDSAAGGQAGATYNKSLGTAYTNNTNGLTDTLLTYPIAANAIWYAEYDLTISCSGVGGVKFAIDIPTGATVEGFVTGYSTGLTAATASRINADNTATTNPLCTVAGTQPARIWARVKNGSTAGTVVLRAQSTTNGQTSTILVGSTMKAQRIVEV